MLVDEAAATPHAIDFLHPRKKPESRNTPRQKLVIAATLATMCFVAVMYVWFQLSELDDQLAQLTQQKLALKADEKKAGTDKAEADLVQTFLDHNFNWLDDLNWLSERLPPAQDVLLTQVQLASTSAGGQVTIEGFTEEKTEFTEIAQQLRTPERDVKNVDKTGDEKREKYKYGFKQIVSFPAKKSDISKPSSPNAKGGASPEVASRVGGSGAKAPVTGVTGSEESPGSPVKAPAPQSRGSAKKQ
jgi:hypothetical protein